MGDLNLARILYTVGCFLAFMLILLYAYGRKAKKSYLSSTFSDEV